MLYLAYTFETTDVAHEHSEEFWEWMDARAAWFYRGLDMVMATSWRCETQPGQRLLIHHEVAFADEAGLARYRDTLATRGLDQKWELRRRGQDRWYRIVARSVQKGLPVPMAVPSS
ncbi:hypothetical protein ACIQVO_38410 [Streptomyces sp. NPDC101062]|uniref:hypothetical protein n=1 Tax=unclassified Streptomyces TaxID=2593676 RepID=UPI0038112CC9